MFKSILLPIDLAAEASWKPVKLAVDLARAGRGTLYVMSALADFGMSSVGSYFDKSFETNAVEDMAAELESWSAEHVPDEVAAEVHLAHGTIYDEIMRLADKLDRDAIMMTAHRPELRDYPLGPNAAWVVRHGRKSVLVTRD